MPYLFSYGTLQQKGVQLSTFGRELVGATDHLVGFILEEIKIEDEAVVGTSGKQYHPIAKSTNNGTDRVAGRVFEITDEELQQSDDYEVDAYKRVATTLESGKVAWVYVGAD